jgi:hypothetical protein
MPAQNRELSDVLESLVPRWASRWTSLARQARIRSVDFTK